MPVVYSVPGMDRVEARKDVTYRTVGETALKMDVYLPPGLAPRERRPAVLFVHGGPVGPTMSPKDWGALWAFSGGGTFLSRPLAERPPYLRALVSYYAVLDNRVPPPGVQSVLSDDERREMSPAAQLGPVAPLPFMLIARAGKDNPLLNVTVDTFVREGLAAGLPLELLNHPTGQHGFDILDDDARSKEIIARTLDFLNTHLR